MLISSQLLPDVFDIDISLFVHLSHAVKNFFINFEFVNSDFYPLSSLLRRHICLLVPVVRCDLSQTISELRIRHKYVLYQTYHLLREMACELISSIQDLLVKTLSI